MAERLPSSKGMMRGRNQDERGERRRVSTASSRDEEIEETLQRIQKQGKYVKMNVGGVLYCTTLGTLTKHDNMLRAMFSERIPLQRDEEGEWWWWASNGITDHSGSPKVGSSSTAAASTLAASSTTSETTSSAYPIPRQNAWNFWQRPSQLTQQRERGGGDL